VSVRYVEAGDRYRIIAGECRYRAAREAGLIEIPCWVRTPRDSEILLQQIVENWQRSDLNPFELAESLAILRDSNGYSQQQLAQTTGKSKGEISKLLSILELSPEVQDVARSDTTGRLTKRHLYALRSFPETRQLRLVASIQAGRHTAESLEKLADPGRSSTQHNNLQYRTFRTKTADVRMTFRTTDVTPELILEALREVRRMVTEDGER